MGLVPPLIAWGTRAAAVYGLSRLFSDEPIQELKAMLIGWIVEEAAGRAGLQLDPSDPFSDASMAAAVSNRIGIPLRSLRDQQMVLEDVDDYAAARLSEKIGFQISSLRDPAKARADLETAALAVVAEKTGIPIAPGPGGFDIEEIKAQVLDWARAKLTAELAGSATEALNVLGGAGVDFESLTAEINGKLIALGSGESLDSAGLAMHVAESLVKSSVQRFTKVAAGLSKKSRRAMQVRAAQQKFRSIHGNRQQYVPLGMVGTVG